MLPNKRLKLAAPLLNNPGCRSEISDDRLTFVNLLTRRRSLSAIR